jgi:hypothetical protein
MAKMVRIFFLPISFIIYSYALKNPFIHILEHTSSMPKLSLPSNALRKVTPLTALIAAQTASAVPNSIGVPEALGFDSYTNLGELSICRMVNGLWQMSGAHGFSPEKATVVNKMTQSSGK